MKLEELVDYPFYKTSRDLFIEIQAKQIHKGFSKYGEVFNPQKWSAEELLNHAMEEAVDEQHYLVGIYMKLKEWESNLKMATFMKDLMKEEDWKNDYFRGLYNGVELSLSIIESRLPDFKEG